MGLQFSVHDQRARLFFPKDDSLPAYATRFEESTGFGVLDTYGNDGKVQHLLGHWQEDDSGQDVFVKSTMCPQDNKQWHCPRTALRGRRDIAVVLTLAVPEYL